MPAWADLRSPFRLGRPFTPSSGRFAGVLRKDHCRTHYVFSYKMALPGRRDPTARRDDIVPQKVKYLGEE